MKQVVFFWNRLYFGFFDYNRRTQIFIYRIFVHLLFSLRHKQKVRRFNNEAISALSDTKFSTVLMIADITMLAFTALLTWTLMNLMSMFLPCVSLATLDEINFCVITAIPSLAINYFMLWRKDKYLEYFELFQKTSRNLNTRWIFISMMCMSLSLTFFILSFCIM